MSANEIRVAVVGQRLDEELHLDVPGTCALDASDHPIASDAVQGFGRGTPGRGDLRPLNLAERRAV